MQANGRQQSNHADAHSYGVLATQLTAALSTARAALAPHAERIADGTVTQLDGLVDELARRRIRIAIYGEVKAGKSTLLNAIAGTALSPVAFEPLTSVPVHVTYGPTTAWRVGERRLENLADLEQLMRDGAGAAAPVMAETNLDLLQLGGQVDLVDTPGVGSDDQLDAVTADALRALDAVVMVVRYPALFTQFTRRLVEGLDADVGKLFVVWNLDAMCCELSPAERARHAETLRTQVAGAHDLFLVDARSGFDLDTFTNALRQFVSSSGRDVVALREAAKHAHGRLAAAQQVLGERRTALERTLVETRQRLDAVQADAIRAEAAARARAAEFETAAASIAQDANAAAVKLAAAAVRQVRAARRRWIRTADLAALDTALTEIVTRYAEAVEAACGATQQALQAAAKSFGSTVASAPRARSVLAAALWAPEDRQARATSGRWRRVRRALFRRWYLPAVAGLERVAMRDDLRAQAAWRDALVAAASQDAKETLARRLDEIGQRAAQTTQQIKSDANHAANEAEAAQLRQHLPLIADQVTTITTIAAEARALLAAS